MSVHGRLRSVEGGGTVFLVVKPAVRTRQLVRNVADDAHIGAPLVRRVFVLVKLRWPRRGGVRYGAEVVFEASLVGEYLANSVLLGMYIAVLMVLTYFISIQRIYI